MEDVKSLEDPKNWKPLPNQNASREVGRTSYQNSKTLAKVLSLEASQSSLDIFQRSPVLITSVSSFEQKNSFSLITNGPTLQIEVVGDRNNFMDLQKHFFWR